MPYKLFQVFLYCFSLLFLKLIYMIFEVSIIPYILFPQFVLFSEFPVSPSVHIGVTIFTDSFLLFSSRCADIATYFDTDFFQIIKL